MRCVPRSATFVKFARLNLALAQCDCAQRVCNRRLILQQTHVFGCNAHMCRFAITQMQLWPEQKQRLADVIAVFRDLMQQIAAQDLPLLPQPVSSSSAPGSASSSSTNTASNSIAELQNHSRLQQNMQLWAGVKRLQRKVRCDDVKMITAPRMQSNPAVAADPCTQIWACTQSICVMCMPITHISYMVLHVAHVM
jgi:hypothetical protein